MAMRSKPFNISVSIDDDYPNRKFRMNEFTEALYALTFLCVSDVSHVSAPSMCSIHWEMNDECIICAKTEENHQLIGGMTSNATSFLDRTQCACHHVKFEILKWILVSLFGCKLLHVIGTQFIHSLY